MIIVGERINTSRKAIDPAVRNRDTGFIQQTAKDQADSGANYIDVNAGTLLADEPAALEWLVKTVQAVVNLPLCIDSPNAKATEVALSVHQGKALINSISGEKNRFNAMLPLVTEYKTAVIALCMDDAGIQETPEKQLEKAKELGKKLFDAGVAPQDVYFDPLVRPISASSESGYLVLETIRLFKATFPDSHIICGLSNVSFGLPQRKLLNTAFLIMAISAGLDAAILDPLDKRLMSLLAASRVLLNQDEFAAEYIALARDGKLEA
ncbi:MAG: methyltetrahydrofolate cobalamin methyltransferase [bacterium]|nr:methyltetrahydrofolate cobalamin methyltransferase [bacterium]